MDNQQATLMTLLQSNSPATVRAASLEALNTLQFKYLDKALTVALADKNQAVRSKALSLLPESPIEEDIAVRLFKGVLQKGTYQEQQAVLQALGNFKGKTATKLLGEQLQQLITGKADPKVQLDIMEAIDQQGNEANVEKMENYLIAQRKTDPIADYRGAIAGGNPERGRGIFYWNEAVR